VCLLRPVPALIAGSLRNGGKDRGVLDGKKGIQLLEEPPIREWN